MKTNLALAALSLAVSTGAALAAGGSYSGNWPLTVSHSQLMNGNYCLTVTDSDGSGWPQHSGSATIPQYTFGEFQVIRGKFVADIVVPLQGQNGALIFTSDGHDGNIGNGAVLMIEGGAPLDMGIMTVGTKGGC